LFWKTIFPNSAALVQCPLRIPHLPLSLLTHGLDWRDIGPTWFLQEIWDVHLLPLRIICWRSLRQQYYRKYRVLARSTIIFCQRDDHNTLMAYLTHMVLKCKKPWLWQMWDCNVVLTTISHGCISSKVCLISSLEEQRILKRDVRFPMKFSTQDSLGKISTRFNCKNWTTIIEKNTKDLNTLKFQCKSFEPKKS
jgi:hypothetical protein